MAPSLDLKTSASQTLSEAHNQGSTGSVVFGSYANTTASGGATASGGPGIASKTLYIIGGTILAGVLLIAVIFGRKKKE